MIKHTKVKQSKMTLDKLVLMMGNGFNEVHERINTLDKKFTQEIGGLKEEVGGLKEKIDEVINTQDKILKDVEDLKDEKVMGMGFRDRFNELEKRVLILETKGKK